MPNRITCAKLQIDSELYDLINNYICPATDTDPDRLWHALAQLFNDFTPRNQALLQKRVDLQQQINDWYQNNPTYDAASAQQFLRQIGYLVEQGPDFHIETTNVDKEIAHIAGPQLVVPINNARYALNAANARWGSLFDALYGSNVISNEGDLKASSKFNTKRAQAVIAYVFDFLDKIFPLTSGSFHQASRFSVDTSQLIVTLTDGSKSQLQDASLFAGYQGNQQEPSSVLFKHHDLHIQLCIDANHPIAQSNQANLCDVIVESAITAIQDCEDSVAAVDGHDKTLVYRNWFELMQASLTTTFNKNGQLFTRKLTPNKTFLSAQGESFELAGRCTLLVRNVGHLMTTPAVLNEQGNELPEGILDACMTSLAALNDIRGKADTYGNTKTGSLYIVKPKMHGIEEVAFSNDLFAAVEDLLKLPRYTLKMGIMDEERRTSLNLKECIRAAKNRVIFINTGFLDRTADEIHTSMRAGTFAPKNDLKQATWLKAYEKQNVQIGLACGFQHKAQIGKGMWAIPDDLNSMMLTKLEHPRSGANTAWVPSPTAATLHALHYHQTNVWHNQQTIAKETRVTTLDLLELAVANPNDLSAEAIQQELNNNCQGILGYTVRWIDNGIGCSKVADVNNVGLMEDRATLRISSQLIANWLYHGLVSCDQVEQTLKSMAKVVDQQNASDPNYKPMSPDFDGLAFQAAQDLIYKGSEFPNGYTEPSLHRRRLQQKQARH